MIPISKLKLNPTNPRIIKDDKFKKLVQSLKDFPEMMEKRPMVCVTDVDGKLFPIGGNMRLKALRELGTKEIPDSWVVMADDWTEEQRKEFTIRDNVGFGEWNWDELQENWDSEKLVSWGLEVPEWESEKLEAVEDYYDAELPEEPKTVLGDLYEIGEHRLLCGDSTDSDSVAKLMNGKKADMVFTDPPFDLEDLSFTDNLFLFTIGHIFILNSEQRNVDISAKHRNNLIRWYAVDFRQANLVNNNMPMTRVDFIAEFRNSEKVKFYNQHKGFSTLLQIAKIHSSKVGTIHKQEKKVELPYVFIEHFSKINEICLDLFLGSGTTMVASHQLKRKCYGMELEPKYCDVIVNRMLKFDPDLRIKRNGIDVTDSFKLK
jgi:site-specific DNA-methyltransferase (adenine-specific)